MGPASSGVTSGPWRAGPDRPSHRSETRGERVGPGGTEEQRGESATPRVEPATAVVRRCPTPRRRRLAGEPGARAVSHGGDSPSWLYAAAAGSLVCRAHYCRQSSRFCKCSCSLVGDRCRRRYTSLRHLSITIPYISLTGLCNKLH